MGIKQEEYEEYGIPEIKAYLKEKLKIEESELKVVSIEVGQSYLPNIFQ